MRLRLLKDDVYVMALSSSLVAMGFLSQSQTLFRPFVATVLPAVFLLGLFTVVRLVDTGVESAPRTPPCGARHPRGFESSGKATLTQEHALPHSHCPHSGFCRTLGAQAAAHFTPEQGRWPEVESPSLRLGVLCASLGTTASMIAVINNVVAGAVVALLVQAFGPTSPHWLSKSLSRRPFGTGRSNRVTAKLIEFFDAPLTREESRTSCMATAPPNAGNPDNGALSYIQTALPEFEYASG